MNKLSKKEIIDFVLQNQCAFKPDTVYRRMRRGMSLQEAMILPARSRVATRRFYVYYLTYPIDVIFYVGSGTGDRAWRYWVKPYIEQDTSVAKKVRELILAGVRPKVIIVKENFSGKEARELESKLIKDLQPECNYIGSLKYEIWGEKFVSLREIANDSRCKCSWPRLKARMKYGWELKDAVKPPTRSAFNKNQNRGTNGKFTKNL